MPAAAETKVRAKTPGALIDRMHNLREEKRKLEAQVSVIKTEYDALEIQLIETLDKLGTTIADGKFASVKIKESVVPQVEDWDKFYGYIQKNKYWHLLERRPSAVACRELFESKGSIPGVEPFVKRSAGLLNKQGAK